MSKVVITYKFNRLIMVEDCDFKSEPPIFILADRFKVYKLQVLKHDNLPYGIRGISFLVLGDKFQNEKLYIYFTFDCSCDMIVAVKLKKLINFDREMSLLLLKSLLVRFRETETYNISHALLAPLKK